MHLPPSSSSASPASLSAAVAAAVVSSAAAANGAGSASSPFYSHAITSMWGPEFHSSVNSTSQKSAISGTLGASTTSASSSSSAAAAYSASLPPPHSNFAYPPTPPIDMKLEAAGGSNNAHSGGGDNSLYSSGSGQHHGHSGSHGASGLLHHQMGNLGDGLSLSHHGENGGKSLMGSGGSGDPLMTSLAFPASAAAAAAAAYSGLSSSSSPNGRKLQEGMHPSSSPSTHSPPQQQQQQQSDPVVGAGALHSHQLSAAAVDSSVPLSGNVGTVYPYFSTSSSASSTPSALSGGGGAAAMCNPADLSSPLYGSYSTTGVFSAKTLQPSRPRSKVRANAGKTRRWSEPDCVVGTHNQTRVPLSELEHRGHERPSISSIQLSPCYEATCDLHLTPVESISVPSPPL